MTQRRIIFSNERGYYCSAETSLGRFNCLKVCQDCTNRRLEELRVKLDYYLTGNIIAFMETKSPNQRLNLYHVFSPILSNLLYVSGDSIVIYQDSENVRCNIKNFEGEELSVTFRMVKPNIGLEEQRTMLHAYSLSYATSSNLIEKYTESLNPHINKILGVN